MPWGTSRSGVYRGTALTPSRTSTGDSSPRSRSASRTLSCQSQKEQSRRRRRAWLRVSDSHLCMRKTSLAHTNVPHMHPSLLVWCVDGQLRRTDRQLESVLVLSDDAADGFAPVTAFDWCGLAPTRIVSARLDGLCVVWDLTVRDSLGARLASPVSLNDRGSSAEHSWDTII